MAEKVADYVLSRLREWGIERIYGYPGDGINAFLGALDRAQEQGGPEFIQARHEEMAAFMACGHAKFAGPDVPGVCMATSGPGAIHLLNGLYDAKLDHVPVLAIVGQQKRTSLGAHYQQEIDLQSLYKDVAEFVEMCTEPAQIRHLIDRAIRIALDSKTVCAIIVPNDVAEMKAVPSPPREHGSVYSSVGYTRPRVLPQDSDIQHAAEILNEGEKVAILIGQGARGAAAEIEQVAELLGAGVAKALLGKDVLPDDLPWVTGSIGLLGTTASYRLMMECDTLLTVGSNFPYTQFFPELDQARAIQIDRSAAWIGMRYPYELNLVGDAKATLRALIPLLRRKEDRGWRQQVEDDVADWWQTAERRAMTDADPVNPMRVVHELSERLPLDAIVASDSGSAANWYARHLKFRGDVRGSLSGNLATMGPGVPYAIGAKWAHPDRPVIALVGDGAMQMNGLAEHITIAKYFRQWTDPRLVVAVLHNDDLNQVTWEMRAMAGAPKFAESQRLPDVDYAAFARSLGLQGINVDKPEDVGPAWDTALSAGTPTVLDVRTDPDVPPIPPHATFAQAKATASAVLHGDEDSAGFIRQGIKQKVQQYLPGTKDGD